MSGITRSRIPATRGVLRGLQGIRDGIGGRDRRLKACSNVAGGKRSAAPGWRRHGTARQAISMAAAREQADLQRQIEARLRPYEAGEPYLEPTAHMP